MFAKIEVNGEGAARCIEFLKAEQPERGNGDIAWNFTKFLVDGTGKVLERIEPKTTPEEIEPRIQALLG